MKKIILFLFATSVLFLMSCDTTGPAPTQTYNNVGPTYKSLIDVSGHSNSNIYTYELDSCEYIGKIFGSSNDKITHKGNCKYCQQRQAILIESIIRKILAEQKK